MTEDNSPNWQLLYRPVYPLHACANDSEPTRPPLAPVSLFLASFLALSLSASKLIGSPLPGLTSAALCERLHA